MGFSAICGPATRPGAHAPAHMCSPGTAMSSSYSRSMALLRLQQNSPVTPRMACYRKEGCVRFRVVEWKVEFHGLDGEEISEGQSMSQKFLKTGFRSSR